jgi:hypothetical protein
MRVLSYDITGRKDLGGGRVELVVDDRMEVSPGGKSQVKCCTSRVTLVKRGDDWLVEAIRIEQMKSYRKVDGRDEPGGR